MRYWDTAYQKKKTSDFTVGVKFGMSRDGIAYILHVARTKGTPHEVEKFIANVAAQDTRSIRIILQQEPGSGSALWIDSMRRGALLGYPVESDAVKGSKFERSQPFRASAEAGQIKLLRGAWNDDFLDECEQFSPDEREYEHDDQVDAVCGAFNRVTKPQPYEYIPVPRGGIFSSNHWCETLNAWADDQGLSWRDQPSRQRSRAMNKCNRSFIGKGVATLIVAVAVLLLGLGASSAQDDEGGKQGRIREPIVGFWQVTFTDTDRSRHIHLAFR